MNHYSRQVKFSMVGADFHGYVLKKDESFILGRVPPNQLV